MKSRCVSRIWPQRGRPEASSDLEAGEVRVGRRHRAHEAQVARCRRRTAEQQQHGLRDIEALRGMPRSICASTARRVGARIRRRVNWWIFAASCSLARAMATSSARRASPPWFFSRSTSIWRSTSDTAPPLACGRRSVRQQFAVALEEIRIGAQPGWRSRRRSGRVAARSGSGRWMCSRMMLAHRVEMPGERYFSGAFHPQAVARALPADDERTAGQVHLHALDRAGHRRMPVAAAAQAPVPQAWVSPTPRSNTRRRTCPRPMISRKPTFTRRAKRGCDSSAGPMVATGAVATLAHIDDRMRIAHRRDGELHAPCGRSMWKRGPAWPAASKATDAGENAGSPMSTATVPGAPSSAAMTPGGALQLQVAVAGQAALAQQLGQAAHAIAALLHLAAVGVEDAVVGQRAVAARRFEHQRLVEADAAMPVGELPPLRGARWAVRRATVRRAR